MTVKHRIGSIQTQKNARSVWRQLRKTVDAIRLPVRTLDASFNFVGCASGRGLFMQTHGINATSELVSIFEIIEIIQNILDLTTKHLKRPELHKNCTVQIWHVIFFTTIATWDIYKVCGWRERYSIIRSLNVVSKIEFQLNKTVKAKMDQMQNLSMSWIDVQFLRKAVDVLSECRNTLMFTYIFAFYLKRDNNSMIFESNQKDLEMETEQLSGLLERDLENEDLLTLKQKVLKEYLINLQTLYFPGPRHIPLRGTPSQSTPWPLRRRHRTRHLAVQRVKFDNDCNNANNILASKITQYSSGFSPHSQISEILWTISCCSTSCCFWINSR